MKVTLGKDGLSKTWQNEFPESTECVKCNGESRIAFVSHEGLDENDRRTKHIWTLRNNGGKGDYWPHDCCSVAVYFCKDCFTATALWNQG